MYMTRRNIRWQSGALSSWEVLAEEEFAEEEPDEEELAQEGGPTRDRVAVPEEERESGPSKEQAEVQEEEQKGGVDKCSVGGATQCCCVCYCTLSSCLP